ncbi:EamA family transporter [Actinomadura sp. WMMA1423]|uniref:EamA family transporter n=1 Tax=Actinomadura sp. WMMA1423 TaxID=2591108 RepID=UPI00197ACEB9|nr:EamA family transporter [Actinomadura sp. WMMA1423]
MPRLAWAVAFAALLAMPFATPASGTPPRPEVLLAGLGLALLSAVVPWSLDMAALRRLPARTVAVMVSLEPAAGAFAGLLLLDERLTWCAWLAVARVSAAASGAAVGEKVDLDLGSSVRSLVIKESLAASPGQEGK